MANDDLDIGIGIDQQQLKMMQDMRKAYEDVGQQADISGQRIGEIDDMIRQKKLELLEIQNKLNAATDEGTQTVLKAQESELHGVIGQLNTKKSVLRSIRNEWKDLASAASSALGPEVGGFINNIIQALSSRLMAAVVLVTVAFKALGGAIANVKDEWRLATEQLKAFEDAQKKLQKAGGDRASSVATKLGEAGADSSPASVQRIMSATPSTMRQFHVSEETAVNALIAQASPTSPIRDLGQLIDMSTNQTQAQRASSFNAAVYERDARVLADSPQMPSSIGPTSEQIESRLPFHLQDPQMKAKRDQVANLSWWDISKHNKNTRNELKRMERERDQAISQITNNITVAVQYNAPSNQAAIDSWVKTVTR